MLDNKSIVFQHLDTAWNKGELKNLKHNLSNGFFYKTTFTDEILNANQYLHFIETLRDAIPNLSVDIEMSMSDGNHVMTQVSFIGEVTKSFYGIPASPRLITFPAISIWKIENNKISSLDTLIDITGISRQIGSAVSPQMPLNTRS